MIQIKQKQLFPKKKFIKDGTDQAKTNSSRMFPFPLPPQGRIKVCTETRNKNGGEILVSVSEEEQAKTTILIFESEIPKIQDEKRKVMEKKKK
ncbi:hypothetical protein L484_016831 [Morus notabilis]|uniref:Uncharacterized protein n=1 Tax=Morus notabilis TaxID=981085 RepID=W9QLQ1_9ROSA|nr:hypothetical protein L484_016831 [Morus notabilis]